MPGSQIPPIDTLRLLLFKILKSGFFEQEVTEETEGPLFQRLEMLRLNAQFIRKGNWKPPVDDGTFVRKTVGAPR